MRKLKIFFSEFIKQVVITGLVATPLLFAGVDTYLFFMMTMGTVLSTLRGVLTVLYGNRTIEITITP